MNYLKLNETGVIHGKKVKCVKWDGCKGCAFVNTYDCITVDCESPGFVKFIEVE